MKLKNRLKRQNEILNQYLKDCKPNNFKKVDVDISVNHYINYSQIFISWENVNEPADDIRRKGKYYIYSYKYKSKEDILSVLESLEKLNEIYPYLRIKKNQTNWIKSLCV